MKFKNVRKAIGIIALSMVAASGFAQDLIARQAPSDRRMNDLRNVRLNTASSSFGSADLQNPAAHIYTSWTNDRISKVSGHVASNYKIDLRGFHMPTPSRKVTSNFGPRWGRSHEGIDIKVYVGDTIRAAFDGKVRLVKFNANGYGYYIVIRHPNGLETLYGHLSKQLVRENQIVRAGEIIGLGGNTGRSTGSHLHFETRLLGKAINPAYMFDFVNQDVTGDYYIAKTGAMAKADDDARLTQAVDNSKRENVNNGPRQPEIFNRTNRPAAQTEARTAQPAVAPSTPAQQKPKTTARANAKTYEVKPGDTLYSIAHANNMSVDALKRLNGIGEGTNIRVGQVLKCS